MKHIYIASSWKNQHAVEMLTKHLRAKGYQVNSFVENNELTPLDHEKGITFDQWCSSASGDRCFDYDVKSAMNAALVIYISPSGTDAWAEVGAAYARRVPILGLYAKGEPAGLMRKMMLRWHYNFIELLKHVDYCMVSSVIDPASR